MADSNIIVSSFCPLGTTDDSITIPQFMSRYNPDNVPNDKLIHADTVSDKTLTYGGLRIEAAQCAWGLQQKLGLKEGDVVSVVAPSCTEFVLLAHATLWAGAVFSPMNPASTVKDIVHVFNLVRPSHIAVAASHLKVVLEAIRLCDLFTGDTKPHLITLLDRVEGIPKFPEDVTGRTSTENLPPYDLGGKSARDVVAFICFSSGTTGKVKGVKLSHYNLVVNTLQYRSSIPLHNHSRRSEVFFPPYCHIYGLTTAVIQGSWFGNFTCGMPAFDLEVFCAKMVQYKATWAHLVPPVALLLTSSEILQKYDLSSLEYIIIAAAPLKKALQLKLKARFRRAKVLQGYGLSECSPGVMFQHDNDEESVGTVGKLFVGTEARLVSPSTGKDVQVGEEGELWLRGPQVMMGYVGDEAATRNTFSEGWLKTGDVMVRDANDNFYVTDRLKELIKYKGFQVAPSELEDILLRHPDVTDAAVCAIYDDSQATEVPLAYVSLKEEHCNDGVAPLHKQATLDGVRDWFDGQVAGYKKLRGGVFHLQQLPKTASGKILRKDLPAKLKESRQSRL